MVWDNILNEIKKLKTSNPVESNPNPPEEPKPLQTEVTEREWWHLSDALSRQDELLEAILLQLKAMAEVVPPSPPPPEPEEPVFPPGIEPKLDIIAREQILTKELLEGFNFVTNQSVVPTPGTPTEVISTVRTYLILIRAHTTNATDVYVGGQGVTAGTGFILGPGEATVVPIDAQKKRVFVDAATAGDGVSWMALVD